MFALARNSWKFQQRDKRIRKVQNIEFETFAPDTIDEVFNARRLLEIWTAKASLRRDGKSVDITDQVELKKLGRDILSGKEEVVNKLEVLGENMENSRRKVIILKTYKAYHAYGDMLHHYAVKNLLAYFGSHPEATFLTMQKDLKVKRQQEWVNLGGQIMQKDDLQELRSDIGSGKLNSWGDIHDRYNKLWDIYPLDKQKHAYGTLCEFLETDKLTEIQWESALNKAVDIQEYICDQVYTSRKKDYDNPFRQATFRNPEEMKAAIGTIDDNSFIIQVRKETSDFKKLIADIKSRN
jgi:hypothetical protein